MEQLPFCDAAFHLVTANMVVEHVERPSKVLSEIERVLKPGGTFLFHTPNYHNYKVFLGSLLPAGVKKRLIRLLEQREEHDVFPTCYRLNTPSAIRRETGVKGLRLKDLRLVNTSAIAMLGPFAIIELVLIRLLNLRPLAGYRSNIIALIEKAP